MKYLTSLSLIVLLLQTSFVLPIFAKTKEEKLAEKVKAGILKLKTGPDAKIKLKLKDGTKIKGYITEAGEDGFTVMNTKTNETISVSYLNVKQVKGNNLSEGVKILIGIGAIIALVVISLAIYNAQGGG